MIYLRILTFQIFIPCYYGSEISAALDKLSFAVVPLRLDDKKQKVQIGDENIHGKHKETSVFHEHFHRRF
jgi:hypothetical protein